MKAPVIFLALAAGWAPTAQPVRADDPVTPPVRLPPIHLVQADNPAVPAAPPAQAENPLMPNAGFPASRYEALWTKSPFAVATSEATADTSPDYMLVGIANVDGIFYASVIDAHNQEHFLISSDKPNRGLTLTSITRSHDGSDTYAAVQKDGQPITLKLEAPPPAAAVANMSPTNTVAMPGSMTPQIPMPGATPSFPNVRPPTRFRRPIIHLPPASAQQQQPAPAQPAPTPPPPPQ